MFEVKIGIALCSILLLLILTLQQQQNLGAALRDISGKEWVGEEEISLLLECDDGGNTETKSFSSLQEATDPSSRRRRRYYSCEARLNSSRRRHDAVTHQYPTATLAAHRTRLGGVFLYPIRQAGVSSLSPLDARTLTLLYNPTDASMTILEGNRKLFATGSFSYAAYFTQHGKYLCTLLSLIILGSAARGWIQNGLSGGGGRGGRGRLSRYRTHQDARGRLMMTLHRSGKGAGLTGAGGGRGGAVTLHRAEEEKKIQ